jgi:hypothetical protein
VFIRQRSDGSPRARNSSSGSTLPASSRWSISALPPEIGQLTALQSLDLGGNQLPVPYPEFLALGQPEATRRVLAYLRGELESLPDIPAQKPAAVEPVWRKDRLTLSKTPVKSDLKGRNFTAALKSLRAELGTLSKDIAGEANIDRRFVSYLHRLADQFPQKPPRQPELFQLGHAQAVLAGYSKTVNEEWPDFLAARYHALTLHFDETIRQSPLWREFKRNAARQSLNSQQVAAVPELATAAGHILRENEAQNFIDPVLPQTLENLAEPLHQGTSDADSPDLTRAEKEQLAYDVIESFNNVLKRVVDAAIWVGQAASTVAQEVSGTVKEAAKGFGVEDSGVSVVALAASCT